MEMSNLILRGDILTLQIRIEGKNYRFAIRWKEPHYPYDITWNLESYMNIDTGEKNLKKDQIEKVLNTINAKWKWNVE